MKKKQSKKKEISVTVRFPAELHAYLKALSKKMRRSFNGTVVEALYAVKDSQ